LALWEEGRGDLGEVDEEHLAGHEAALGEHVGVLHGNHPHLRPPNHPPVARHVVPAPPRVMPRTGGGPRSDAYCARGRKGGAWGCVTCRGGGRCDRAWRRAPARPARKRHPGPAWACAAHDARQPCAIRRRRHAGAMKGEEEGGAGAQQMRMRSPRSAWQSARARVRADPERGHGCGRTSPSVKAMRAGPSQGSMRAELNL
jgi:hypothetical protein